MELLNLIMREPRRLSNKSYITLTKACDTLVIMTHRCYVDGKNYYVEGILKNKTVNLPRTIDDEINGRFEFWIDRYCAVCRRNRTRVRSKGFAVRKAVCEERRVCR